MQKATHHAASPAETGLRRITDLSPDREQKKGKISRPADASSGAGLHLSRQSAYSRSCFDGFVLETYLPHVRQYKRSWQVDERIYVRYLAPAFGKARFQDIGVREVESWFQSLLSTELARTTCHRIYAVLQHICTLALRRGLFQGPNPCSLMRLPRIFQIRERYLTREEGRRLMEKLEKATCQEARALRLLLLTGARKSEILHARWENVHLDQQILVVPLSKSGKPRYISLSSAAAAVIREIPRNTDSPWLFPGRDPEKHVSDIYRYWDSLRKDLSIGDVRIHDLRHTFASLLVNAGHSLYEVQCLLGHSDPRTTMRYAHMGQTSLRAAAEEVGGFLHGAKPSGRRRIPPESRAF